MSTLYGAVTGDKARTSATRSGHRNLSAWAQTQYARVTTELDAQGKCTITMHPVSGYETAGQGEILWSGNINVLANLCRAVDEAWEVEQAKRAAEGVGNDATSGAPVV